MQTSQKKKKKLASQQCYIRIFGTCLELWKAEEKKENRLDFPVEREPVNGHVGHTHELGMVYDTLGLTSSGATPRCIRKRRVHQ